MEIQHTEGKNDNSDPTDSPAGGTTPSNTPPRAFDPEGLDYKRGDETSASEDSQILIPPKLDKINTQPITKFVEPTRRSEIWITTMNWLVYHLQLVNGKLSETKTWSYSCNYASNGLCDGGHRTYVTEAGLVFVRGGPQIFTVSANQATEVAIKPSWGPPVMGLSGTRGCVVSYKRDGKRYVGMGWGGIGSSADQLMRFTEFQMANEPPYTIDFSSPTTWTDDHPANGRIWGYSCFIDQRRLIYYSAWTNQSFFAFDLTKKVLIKVADRTPNATVGGGTGSDILNPKGFNEGSFQSTTYAISGDNQGNILVSGRGPSNAASYPFGVYTHAFEPQSQSVWQMRASVTSTWRSEGLAIYARTCFTGGACPAPAVYPDADVGPMSALGDGTVIGLNRTTGTVFTMRLKDRKDLAGGVEVNPIFTVTGDPYMYTDFTGATLYQTSSEITFDFPLAKDPLAIAFTWSNVPGTPTLMKDLQTEIRCYSGTDSGAYQNFVPKEAFKQKKIDVSSCMRPFEHVDVRLTQLNDTTSLMDISKIQITYFEVAK